jgi:hypothetical protein
MVRQTRLRLLLLVLVFGAGSCSLDNTGDVATNEPFGKWIVLTWSIPPIGEVKIDSILFSCHIQPGGLNRTASENLHAIGVTSVMIPVAGGIAANAPVAVNCEAVLQQAPQWASSFPVKSIVKGAPAAATSEKVIRFHITYTPAGDEPEYLVDRFAMSHKPQ